MMTIDRKEKTKGILNWLDSHPLISRRGLEQESGIPEGTLYNAKNRGRVLTVSQIIDVAQVLCRYGYILL